MAKQREIHSPEVTPEPPASNGAAPGAPAKRDNTKMRCVCGHAKSIHSRMYANTSLGTPCNFPDCGCRAYQLS